MFTLDSSSLKEWFLATKRDLPWRRQSDPYAIWVSEVMLQQTQVATVIPYFERWMERFPSIKSLSEATVEEVIKEWEGLGYYSRARNLHEGAQHVVKNYQGILPQNETQLKTIKGLGPYTIGAIRSFAFHQRTPAVDGNVLRVIARYFNLEEDISKPKTVSKIRNIVEEILPNEESWIVNEALIELGATICQRIPKCAQCPLKKTCKAYQHGNEQVLPVKSAKIKITSLYRAVAIVYCDNEILLRKGVKGEIMADLHEFPYFEMDKENIAYQELQQKMQFEWNLTSLFVKEMNTFKQTFTRYRALLLPFIFETKEKVYLKGCEWVDKFELRRLAFSSGHKRILNALYPDRLN